MGVVYEALDPATGRKLALKVLHQSSALDPREEKHAQDRFLREASLAAKIPPHPGIVGVREVGVVDGRRFIGMDLAPGLAMSEWRKQASLTVQKQVAMIRDIALAAHHAHEHGVVHRDLKPENILVDPEGRPRITDFGLA
ncbi:MAG TPA: protein kinase, partial [Planctomycetota bacterium]|nr:protein kinase [Planctomycetota bacterium]